MNYRAGVRRLIVASLTFGCIAIAVAVPTWRDVLAQVGGYDSSFLGCVTDRGGNLVVEFAVGLTASPGSDCVAALNEAEASCELLNETQAIDPTKGKFGTMFRFICQ